MPELFLNEYEILKTLGEGAFASVYKVWHAELNYIRAIKVLNTLVLDEKDKKYKIFLDECSTLLRLGNGSQDNIVRIARPRLLMKHVLVEMDYIEGMDLNSYVEQHCRGFVPVQEVLKLIQDIGSALAYCHFDIYKYSINNQIGEDAYWEELPGGPKVMRIIPVEELVMKYKVLHNDIHSKNIMRRDDGKYILLDFGLAITKDIETKKSLRKEGAPEYKPPEKWDNDLLLSEQSDIYSFGILMYEALTGAVPFRLRGQSLADEHMLMKEHQDSIPPPIGPLRKKVFELANPGATWTKDYPEWLEKMIMKCLEKRPEDRYANGKELFLDIQKKIRPGEDNTHAQKDQTGEVESLTKENAALKQQVIFYSENQKQAEQFNNENKNLKERIEKLKAGKPPLSTKPAYYLVALLLIIIAIGWLNWPMTQSGAHEIVISMKDKLDSGYHYDPSDVRHIKKVIGAYPSYRDTVIRLFAEEAIKLNGKPASENFKNFIVALLVNNVKSLGATDLAGIGIKGISYKGETRNNTPNGIGIAVVDNGIIYIGNWKNGIKTGWGIRVNSDYREVYEGDWENDTANGQGSFFGTNNDISANLPGCRRYTGEWKNGDKNGFGRCYDSGNKLIYEGYFKNDQPLQTFPNQ